MMDGGGWAWPLFWVLFVTGVAGLAVGVWASLGSGYGSSAHDLLDARLARGEISLEDHAARRSVLGSHSTGAPGSVRPLALALGVAGIVAALVVAAVGSWDGGWGHMRGGGMMGGGMMGAPRTAGSAPTPVAGAPRVEVSGSEFAFSPDEARVRAGETVNVVFENDGAVFHTLTVRSLDFELRAEGGERDEGALTASTPGTYELVCAVAGHAEAGMTGTLIVEEADG